ncbi:MAG TPA: CsgG/HfaB family protein [bacterium]|nr:CsgG/HfaB family protein [bacterium]HPN45417.1 CsgG/HfaB family protein [bacterium]
MVNSISKKIAVLVFVFFCLSIAGGNAADDKKQLKKRVAVFSFDDKSSHNYHWWTGQPVGEGMADMLVTALVKTGKYQVMERQEMNKVLEEQNLGQSGIVTQETAAQVGKMLGVELAIFGSVTEFGYSEGSTGGRLNNMGFGVGIKSSKATVGIDIRFVNTTTGEILKAESIRKENSKKGVSLDTDKFNFENQSQFDESIVGKATRDAINEIVTFCDGVVENIPWQAKIVTVSPKIIINSGALGGVNIGDELVVIRAGEELVDPDTGLSLGTTEAEIGRIKVTNNNIGNGKASECVAISGTGFARNDMVRMK